MKYSEFQLPTQEEKADYVLQQFDRIAARYDLTNDVISMGMHRMWKAHAVDLLLGPIRNAEELASANILDVCCGTGDLALMIANRLPASAQVTGVDFSSNMLEVANARHQKQSQDGKARAKLSWLRADAQNLPFEAGTFDGAIVSFGLRNLTNLQKGLDEMARVVKPGKLVLNLDLGHTSIPGFAQIFHLYFRHFVPIVGAVVQNDRKAYTYLPESLTTYPRPDVLSEMFAKASMKEVEHIPLALGSVALHKGTVA